MMSPSLLLVQLLTGLANAMFLFLISSGLSLIFGVTRIVNFAHGSFYMLAGYLTFSITTYLPSSEWRFAAALFVAPAIVALIGWAIERYLLRRIYGAHEILQLLLTFGLVLIVGDLAKGLWGLENKSVSLPELLRGSVLLFGQPFPLYYLLVIGLGPVLTLGLWWILYRTRWGMLVRAATEDREMVEALGVDRSRLFTRVFVFGSLLAGLGGMLASPMIAVSPGMDTTVIIEAFVVVVVGGMGSFPGSLLAALLIGILKSFGILIFPTLSIVLPFAFMAMVLMLRPWGLLGKPVEGEAKFSPLPFLGLHPRRGKGRRWMIGIGPALLLLLLPFFAPPFWLIIASEVLAFALFASSLNLLLGYGGMLSFGHAAYFGLGAYGAALLMVKGGVPMPLALGLAPLLAALWAGIAGYFSVRLSSIYFAMLTLAFAQILYTIAFQWYDFTGGDNGILGIWPSRFVGTPERYYAFTLMVSSLGIYALHRIVRSPFGAALMALRDNPRRAESIGLSRRLYQWIAFLLSGFFSGLAGALFVFQKGSVFPDYLFVIKSIEPLVMVLLGGMQAFLGPSMGSVLYKFLDTFITSATDYWQGVLGVVLIVLVLLFPRGVTGHRWGPPFRRGSLPAGQSSG